MTDLEGLDGRVVALGVRLADDHKDLSDRLFALAGTDNLAGKLAACHRAEAVFALERRVQLERKARVVFDPAEHPRDWHGRFAKVVSDLTRPGRFGGEGDEAHVPTGNDDGQVHRVVRTRHGFEVHTAGGMVHTVSSAEEAATIVHGRYESDRAHREATQQAADRAEAEKARLAHAAEVDRKASETTYYRFEDPAVLEQIARTGVLWGLPANQGSGVTSVRAQPKEPDADRVRGNLARGRVLISFRTKVRPNDKGGRMFAWTPGAPAQRYNEQDRIGLPVAKGKQHPDLTLSSPQQTRFGKIPVAMLKLIPGSVRVTIPTDSNIDVAKLIALGFEVERV